MLFQSIAEGFEVTALGIQLEQEVIAETGILSAAKPKKLFLTTSTGSLLFRTL